MTLSEKQSEWKQLASRFKGLVVYENFFIYT